MNGLQHPSHPTPEKRELKKNKKKKKQRAGIKVRVRVWVGGWGDVLDAKCVCVAPAGPGFHCGLGSATSLLECFPCR